MVSFSYLVAPLFYFSLFIILLYKWRRNAVSSPQKRLPPSPRKLPLIGNLHQLGAYPNRSLQSLSNHYGPLMLLQLGRVPVLVVSSAEAAREIMKNQDLIFSNRPKLSIPDKLMYDSKDVAFAPYGEYWRQVRSICVLQLLSNKRVQSFRNVREEETKLMIERIKEMSSLHTVVNLSDALTSLTNDIVCRVALGKKYGIGDEGKRFKKLLAEFFDLLGTISVSDYIPWLGFINWFNGLNAKVERVAKEFDEFLEGVVQEHISRKEGDFGEDKVEDFVNILLEIQGESKNDSPIDNDAIKALVLDMFAAGTDTTSNTLEWTMTELLRHPNTMKKLQNEVREIAGDKKEITEDDLDKMHYLKAVIKESLRLHIPVPLLVTRESTQDTKVLGYDIAARTQVIINAWAIARDPLLWEDHEEFNPDRFMNTNIDFRGLHFELIPFGAGRRGCPGIQFAVTVNELALAKMVHEFDFGLPNGIREEDLDMTESTGLTLRKTTPLLVVAT